MVIEFHEYLKKYDFYYEFIDKKTKEIVATGIDKETDFPKLTIANDTFTFSTYPKIVKKISVDNMLKRKGKTIGFKVYNNKKVEAIYYQDSLKSSGKNPLLKLTFTLFEYNSEVYVIYKVGFKNEPNHYYCIYNNDKLVSIVERVCTGKDDSLKGIIYCEESFEKISILICSEEIMVDFKDPYANGGPKLSAGNYVSPLKETQAKYDPDFIPRIIAQEGITD